MPHSNKGKPILAFRIPREDIPSLPISSIELNASHRVKLAEYDPSDFCLDFSLDLEDPRTRLYCARDTFVFLHVKSRFTGARLDRGY